MAFDPTLHEIDPATGFQIDKATKTPTNLVGRPHQPVTAERDYPKWVAPHPSHIVRKETDGLAHISTPAFPMFHVNREGGEVTVLVMDEEDEKRALAEHGAKSAEPPKEP